MTYEPIEALRHILDQDETYHAMCVLPSAEVAEIMARAGFDWLLLDMQHALVDRQTMVNMLRALEISRVPAMVRAPWNRPELVGWVLDAGAAGVVAPMINSGEEARELVKACRYAPAGSRSWGALRTMLARPEYSATMGDRVVVAAMIETAAAVENLDEILDTEGLDMIVVGQSDLAVSYGLHPAKGRKDPGHVERLQRIGKGCRDRCLHATVNCGSREEANALRRMGYRDFVIDNDFGLLRRAAAAALSEYRGSAA